MDVKTASRVLDVFNLFADERRPLTYSEISRLLEIPLSSCHGLLKTMVGHGFLYDFGSRQGYYPTQRLLHIATTICSADPLINYFTPVLQRLRNTTEETAILAKLAGSRVVYLNTVESKKTIRYSHEVGGFKLINATSTGKALFEVMTDAARKSLMTALERDYQLPTERTIKTADAFLADIACGTQRGWQSSYGENVDDVMSIAKGFLINGEPYCLAVAGPLERMRANEQSMGAVLIEVVGTLPKNITGN